MTLTNQRSRKSHTNEFWPLQCRSGLSVALFMIFAKLANLMTLRFQMRLPSAVVAHTYDCLRSFLSGLDETLAHCANDAQMSFVCAHINVSLASLFGLCCRKILRPVENILKISPPNTCALPQPKFSAFARIADGGRSCL